MGLNSYVFETMLRTLKTDIGGCKRRALAAGYPDFIVYPEVLQRCLGKKDFPADPLSDQIKIWHRQPQLDYARDPFAVFRYMGYELDVVDFRPERGCELSVNLNEPYRLGSYDLVIDHGTCEHCFNIAQAAQNLANAVCLSGAMVQHLPLNMFNHGFYNLNPTWFWDFYEHNGFEIKKLEGWSMMTNEVFSVAEEVAELPPQSLLTVIAIRKRRRDFRTSYFPIQRIYR